MFEIVGEFDWEETRAIVKNPEPWKSWCRAYFNRYLNDTEKMLRQDVYTYVVRSGIIDLFGEGQSCGG